MSNLTLINENAQFPILSVPWIVKQPTKIVIIPGDSTPTYNAAAQIDADRTAVLASGRDADGKFAPTGHPSSQYETPAMKRKSMRKLNVSSQRLDREIDKMMAMENW